MKRTSLIFALAMVVGCGGADGAPGTAGLDGQPGPAGDAGPAGPEGPAGAAGPAGPAGPAGADGADGANGADGNDGADGATILTGNGAPAAGLGNDGDVYIDLDTRNVYQKDDGAWQSITDLNNGAPGSSIHWSSDEPDPSLGKDGDLCIDITTGDLYAKDAGAWSVVGNLQGPAGDDGNDGDDGTSIHTGSGAPGGALGNDGDLYLDADNGDLYEKASGTWTVTGNLQGAPGSGSAWLTGNGVPDDGDGNDGDVYFDWDTGDAYVKEEGEWSLMGRFVEYQVGGVTWFPFALTSSFTPMDEAVTSFAANGELVTATYSFTGADQRGRLAFNLVGGYFSAGANLSSYSTIHVQASASGLAYDAGEGLWLHLGQGVGAAGCDYAIPAGGVVDLWNPEFCFPGSLVEDVLVNVDQVQIGIVSSGAGNATLNVTSIEIQ